jgi:hypothetical protein
MKKLFALLLFSSYLTGMNLISLEQTKEQKKYHKKCDRVARYFIKQVPKMQNLSEAFDTFQKVHPQVQFLIREHAIQYANQIKKTSTLMVITTHQDIFTSIVQSIIPQHEIKQTVQLKTTQLAEYKNGYAEPIHPLIIVPLGGIKKKNPDKPETISLSAKQQKIFELNAIDAFIILRDYMNQEKIMVKDVIEYNSFSKSSISDNYDDFTDDDLVKSYGWNFDDFLNTKTTQRDKLYEIAAAHTEGRFDRFDERYKMLTKDTNLLMPIKKEIENNILLKLLMIGIPFEPLTKLDKIKDVLLLATPLSITESIIPYLIYNNIKGKFQWFLGSIASCGSGFVIGNWIFPLFDSWNSHALTIHKYFGSNKTTVEKRWSFAILTLFHYILHTIADKFLTIPTLSFQTLGYALHGLRVLSYMAGVFDLRPYVNRKSWSYIFADLFELKKYNHPLERRNKDDKSYTLIDLLNAQSQR